MVVFRTPLYGTAIGSDRAHPRRRIQEVEHHVAAAGVVPTKTDHGLSLDWTIPLGRYHQADIV